MKQRLPKWQELLLMLAGGAVAAVLFWLITGKGAEAPYGSTAIVAGVLLGSFPYAMRVKKLEQEQK
jgi:uncharacterized membrane protein YccC